MMMTGCAVHAVRGLATSLFSCDQSYGNSRPQSRQTTYVPVTEAAAMLRRNLPRTVMGKVHRLCQQPKTISNRLMSPTRLKLAVFRTVALTAPTLPVPTASTQQEH